MDKVLRILPGKGKKEIGLSSDTSDEFATFSNGISVASFQSFGTIPVKSEIMIWVKQIAIRG